MIRKFKYICCCGNPPFSRTWVKEDDEDDKEAFKSQCCSKCGTTIRKIIDV